VEKAVGRLLEILSSSERRRQRGLLIAHDAVGRFVSVDDAARVFACGLVCPVCGQPMSAKQGDVIEWHFAHRPGDHCNSEKWVTVQGRAVLASWLQPGSELRLPSMSTFGKLSRSVTVIGVEEDKLFPDEIAVKVTALGKNGDGELLVFLKPVFQRSKHIRSMIMAMQIDVPLIANAVPDEAHKAFLSSWRREWLYISKDHRPPSSDPQRDRWRQRVIESRNVGSSAARNEQFGDLDDDARLRDWLRTGKLRSGKC